MTVKGISSPWRSGDGLRSKKPFYTLLGPGGKIGPMVDVIRTFALRLKGLLLGMGRDPMSRSGAMVLAAARGRSS